MESSSMAKRSNRVINIHPNEAVITAFPYEPQSSLLDFLKGEPRVLGTLQVMLALIMVGIGTIFAFNFFKFSQKFPLVFTSGYPFWGPFIFIITGCFSSTKKKITYLEPFVMIMNMLSSLTATAGIALTIISFKYQYMYCQAPSLEGICVIGRILFNGILSVLLIITIAELSLSISIAAFRSKCWTRSNEIVFFLPMDVTPESELEHIAEENAIIQFELQEESSNDETTANVQPVFIGGYTFYKLRVSKGSLAYQQSERKYSNNYPFSSIYMQDEQQKRAYQTSTQYEDVNVAKNLVIIPEMPSTDVNTEPSANETLYAAVVTPPVIQNQILEALPLSLHDLPAQDEPSQSLQSESHTDKSSGLSNDKPEQETPSQDITDQDIFSQAQLLPIPSELLGQSFHSALSQTQQPSKSLFAQAIQTLLTKKHQEQQTSEASIFQIVHSLIEQHPAQQSSEASSMQGVQYLHQHHQEEQFSEVFQASQFLDDRLDSQNLESATVQAERSCDKQHLDQQGPEDASPHNIQSLNEQQVGQQFSKFCKIRTIQYLNRLQMDHQALEASKLKHAQYLHKQQVNQQSSEASKLQSAQYLSKQQTDQQSLETSKLQSAQYLSKQQMDQQSLETSKLQSAQYLSKQQTDQQSLETSKLQNVQYLTKQQTDQQSLEASNLQVVQQVGQQSLEASNLQALQCLNMQQVDQQSLEASNLQAVNRQLLEQQFLDNNQQMQQRSQPSIHLLYQDMQSEVMLMTEEWQSKKELHSKKSSKWHFSDEQHKALQSLKQKSTELKTHEKSFSKRKSIDEQIKGWLSPKKHSKDKHSQTKQLTQQPPDKQTEAQWAQIKQSLNQKSSSRQGEDQQGQDDKREEHFSKEQSTGAQNQNQLEVPKLKDLYQVVQALSRHQSQELQNSSLQETQNQAEAPKDLEPESVQTQLVQVDKSKTVFASKSAQTEDIQTNNNRPALQSTSVQKEARLTDMRQARVIQPQVIQPRKLKYSDHELHFNISSCSAADNEDQDSVSCFPIEEEQSEDSN
ncbi:membrane-spanning 4-domains subfamily A member 14 isoform X2 [Erinaceus europaeus]|uniref:Membrane-spanning 4-domains subfamily A member 14 isoform X2 n=1 Tax=Erinaceus europaeus TaxID=9365 RepID=A0ABM3W6N9_ERIEU|nr:membrane-spanning 4-domains subfamily A member 14 isoform X2 [Erinaceus europaeus]